MKKGFTLAEALVTIGIIGLISAIVIPTFMRNTIQQETVARVMTSYNSLQTAYEQVKMNQNNRPPQFWNGDILNLFAEQMNASSATFSTYNAIDNNTAGTASAAQNAIELKNGSVVTYVSNSATCVGSTTGGKTCGIFYVDVNGSQKPNIAGVDVFAFNLTKTGIVPEGGDDTVFATGCPTTGEACTAHVVANNNLSYLNSSSSGNTGNNSDDTTSPSTSSSGNPGCNTGCNTGDGSGSGEVASDTGSGSGSDSNDNSTGSSDGSEDIPKGDQYEAACRQNCYATAMCSRYDFCADVLGGSDSGTGSGSGSDNEACYTGS